MAVVGVPSRVAATGQPRSCTLWDRAGNPWAIPPYHHPANAGRLQLWPKLLRHPPDLPRTPTGAPSQFFRAARCRLGSLSFPPDCSLEVFRASHIPEKPVCLFSLSLALGSSPISSLVTGCPTTPPLLLLTTEPLPESLRAPSPLPAAGRSPPTSGPWVLSSTSCHLPPI